MLYDCIWNHQVTQRYGITTVCSVRFLISGDAMGEILAWRADATGWYQLLRKFRKEVPLTIPGRGPGQASSSSSSLGCVLSLVMNPDKHKGQMVALMRQPAQLKVINMNTYKTHCTCAGFSGYSSSSSSSSSSRNNSGSSSSAGGVFARAQISADGRYVVAGSTVKSEEGMYRLQVWDSQTGHSVHTQLSGDDQYSCSRSSSSSRCCCCSLLL